METLSELLAFCEGNADSPHKGPVMQSFDVFFVVSLNKVLERSRVADDFRRNDAHVTSL